MPMAAITDLPNEVLFQVLDHLDSSDINVLHSIPSLRQRIDGLFCLATDVSVPRKFKWISKHITLSDTNQLYTEKTQLLRVIVEIYDLKNSHEHIKTITDFVSSDISVFDEYIPNTWESGENNCHWLNQLGTRARSVTFENLTKLSLSNVSISARVVNFCSVKWLKLSQCDVLQKTAEDKLKLPSLLVLAVDTTFALINKAIDYENTKLESMTLTGIRDMKQWDNVHCRSLENIHILDGASMTSFQNMTFENLQQFLIRDSDVEIFAFMNLPKLKVLHVEQFVNAQISMYNVAAPQLTQILIWVNRIRDFYNIHIPSVKTASIMLSHEPVPSAINNIDLDCFKDLKSLKICCSAEILTHTAALTQLEVRGPLNNELLFSVQLDHLQELCIYFNHGIREAPLMRCPNLKKLVFSRCLSLQDITMIQDWYPRIESLVIEYCELKEMYSMILPELITLTFLSSTSAPFSVRDCYFPKLKDFEARNLEIKDWIPSEFDFTAPEIAVLSISNFTVNHLKVTTFPNLLYLTATGGIRRLTLQNCDKLIHLNVSKNTELTSFQSDTLKSLTALECEETDYMLTLNLDTPLLQKIIYDDMVRYVHTNMDIHDL